MRACASSPGGTGFKASGLIHACSLADRGSSAAFFGALQVLYFMPAMREAFLAAVPDPDAPDSLADELGLLFRMLAAGGPAA